MAKKLPKAGDQVRNFTESMAPNSVGSPGLRSADQAALQVKFKNDRIRDERRNSPASMPTPMGGMEDWEKDWRDRERVSKRGLRGGATFRPGDGIAR